MDVYTFCDSDKQYIDFELELYYLHDDFEVLSALFKYASQNGFTHALVEHMQSLFGVVSDTLDRIQNSLYYTPVPDDDFALLFSFLIGSKSKSD